MRYQFFVLNAAISALLAVVPQAIGSAPERGWGSLTLAT